MTSTRKPRTTDALAPILPSRLAAGAVFPCEGIQSFFFPEALSEGRSTNIGIKSPVAGDHRAHE